MPNAKPTTHSKMILISLLFAEQLVDISSNRMATNIDVNKPHIILVARRGNCLKAT